MIVTEKLVLKHIILVLHHKVWLVLADPNLNMTGFGQKRGQIIYQRITLVLIGLELSLDT